jgi:hypothetical protein
MRLCFRFEPGFIDSRGRFVEREAIERGNISVCGETGRRRVALRDQISGKIWTAPGGIHSDLLDQALAELDEEREG